MPRRRPGYWKSFDNIRRELFDFMAEQGMLGIMPTTGQLLAAGRKELLSAIYYYYGGLHRVAQRLSLTTVRKPMCYWQEFENLRREVVAVADEYGIPGHMPTEDLLTRAQRYDIVAAIYNYHKGFPAVARQLNLIPSSRPKEEVESAQIAHPIP